jgi:hypothetical protein
MNPLYLLTPLYALTVELPPDLSVEERIELLAGCSTAIAPESCEAATEDGSQDARVEVLGDNSISLEVEQASSTTKLSASRELTFDASDGPIDRARAVGLSLGLMVRILRSKVNAALVTPEPAASKKSDPSQEPPPEAPSPAPTASKSARDGAKPPSAARDKPRGARAKKPSPVDRRFLAVSLDGGVLFDPGISSIEATTDLQVEMLAAGTLGGVASIGFSAGPTLNEPVSVSRISPTLGLDWGIFKGPVDLFGQLEFGAQYLKARVTTSDSELGGWSAVARLSASLRFPGLASVQGHITPRLTVSSSQWALYLDDVPIGKTAQVFPSLLIGIIWWPGQHASGQRTQGAGGGMR